MSSTARLDLPASAAQSGFGVHPDCKATDGSTTGKHADALGHRLQQLGAGGAMKKNTFSRRLAARRRAETKSPEFFIMRR